MTMHLVRGMTTLSSRKRKSTKKTAAVLEEERKTAKLLKSLGYEKGKGKSGSPLPSYTVSETVPTSDLIMRVEGKRKANQYTGNEIAGIGTLHKSNSVPIRKDSNDAKEIARMRRG